MVIDQFMQSYKEMYNQFERLARVCSLQCESILERNGIRAIVSFRAKRLDRLREKVEKRSEKKDYKTVDEVYRDIRDLAGVRIALYFPGDREEVDAAIQSAFTVVDSKDFPQPRTSLYNRRFSGYSARHYHVLIHDGEFSGEVEIQVGSVLMHAWAEVEHDLAYKPRTGTLSPDENAILDELNGLVHAGEIALERLQQAVRRRIASEAESFSNHFELSAYLYDFFKAERNVGMEPIIGRADVLFQFLRLADLDSVLKLKPFLKQVDATENGPIVEQVVDAVLAENEGLYKTYNRARLIVGESDPFGRPDEAVSYFSEERALGFFVRRWIALETVARAAFGEALSTWDWKKLHTLHRIRTNVLDSETLIRLEEIRGIRNKVIHGKEFPSEQQLIEAGRFLENLLAKITEEQPEMEKTILRALKNS